MSRSWGDCVLREFTDREAGSWGGWGGVIEEEGSGSEARVAGGWALQVVLVRALVLF